MPYSAWTEVDRNLWNDPFALTDIVTDTAAGGGGPVDTFPDTINTAYQWTCSTSSELRRKAKG